MGFCVNNKNIQLSLKLNLFSFRVYTILPVFELLIVSIIPLNLITMIKLIHGTGEGGVIGSPLMIR